MTTKYYAVVTFGRPYGRIQSYYTGRTGRTRALAAAREARGTGTCSNAHVLECDTKALAVSADISEIRQGERIIHH